MNVERSLNIKLSFKYITNLDMVDLIDELGQTIPSVVALHTSLLDGSLHYARLALQASIANYLGLLSLDYFVYYHFLLPSLKTNYDDIYLEPLILKLLQE